MKGFFANLSQDLDPAKDNDAGEGAKGKDAGEGDNSIYGWPYVLSFENPFLWIVLFVLTGKKPKGTKCYLPGKNTAAYAILITLHRYDFSAILITLHRYGFSEV